MVIAASSRAAQADSNSRSAYQRSVLQVGKSTPLKAGDLAVGEPYVFFYPFVTTPCLLINLQESVVIDQPVNDNGSNNNGNNDNDQQWRGGVGPRNAIVAYSAICSHKMSHPAKEISFINYRHEPISFYSHEESKTIEKSGLISCCSERSVYDPAQGAKVLGGPAPHPLAAIALEYDESNDQLHATGSYGADMYDRFFDKFGFRASMEHKISDPKTLSEDEVTVQKLSDYSRQTIKC